MPYRFVPPRTAAEKAQLRKEGPVPEARELIFRAGYLTPEECFYQIRKEISSHAYSSVLVWDTAQMSTGFPLIRDEPLFLPSLIDLFHQKDLVSVFIGVRETDGGNREMDFDLESAADYRLSLSHYPTAYDLAAEVFEPSATDKPKSVEFDEQIASVVLDNVTGKHYGRYPRWLRVKVNRGGRTKELLCLETDECRTQLEMETKKRRARLGGAKRWHDA